jgi:hypothetical protein
MRILLLATVLLAVLTIPVAAARDPNPLRGLKRALVLFLGFNLLYMLALRFIYSRLP